jgi:hypothetical protein
MVALKTKNHTCKTGSENDNKEGMNTYKVHLFNDMFQSQGGLKGKEEEKEQEYDHPAHLPQVTDGPFSNGIKAIFQWHQRIVRPVPFLYRIYKILIAQIFIQ